MMICGPIAGAAPRALCSLLMQNAFPIGQLASAIPPNHRSRAGLFAVSSLLEDATTALLPDNTSKS